MIDTHRNAFGEIFSIHWENVTEGLQIAPASLERKSGAFKVRSPYFAGLLTAGRLWQS
jgi:hypothetical protein